jgi:uncharacterized membrane protein YkvA (DUF1232 family)
MPPAKRQPKTLARMERPLIKEDWKRLVWPIVKRLPTYVRLAWALGRDPTIPHRHKLLLYSSVLYSVSPLTFALGVIPLVGQVDNIILLLFGIQQILRSCEPRTARRHLARFGLSTTQVTDDLRTLGLVTAHALLAVGRPLAAHARFAGHVAAGFGRRALRRLTGQAPARSP